MKPFVYNEGDDTSYMYRGFDPTLCCQMKHVYKEKKKEKTITPEGLETFMETLKTKKILNENSTNY